MEKNQELYYDEITNLRKFRSKIDTHAVYKEDLDEFSNEYEELIAQAKVITRVSDRLQKKLDTANLQIREQNDEIKFKNIELKNTVDQLAQARVGKKASTIMLSVALVLFIAEQVFLEPIIDKNIDIPFVGLGILGVLFFIVKILESSLEKYFLNKEKTKILEKEGKEEQESAWN
ncbi:MAG: hypothetical protein RIM99_13765 [Cyclobacteriaceae bacterium]